MPQSKPVPTAEELKELVRRYADLNFPGWELASVSVRIAGLGKYPDELLLVTPLRSGTTSRAPAQQSV